MFVFGELIEMRRQCIRTAHDWSREIEMADADLDVVVRSVREKEVKALTDAARKRHGPVHGDGRQGQRQAEQGALQALCQTYALACGGKAAANHG
jgi:hypothetical protein